MNDAFTKEILKLWTAGRTEQAIEMMCDQMCAHGRRIVNLESPAPKEPASEGGLKMPAHLAEIVRRVHFTHRDPENPLLVHAPAADGGHDVVVWQNDVLALCDAVESYSRTLADQLRITREVVTARDAARSEAQAAKQNLQHAETRIQRLESEHDAAPVPREAPETVGYPVRVPTHQCRDCEAYWIEWPDDGTWSLWSNACGKCCDNSPDFLSRLRKISASDALRLMAERAHPASPSTKGDGK